MKVKSNFSGLAVRLIVALFLFTSSSELIAQEATSAGLKEFKILVEKTEDGIKMQSVQGSAWANLSFSLKNDQTQAVDEYGMTDFGAISSEKDTNLADYLFTITETESGIVLKGIEGTSWTDLSFLLALNSKQAIDQFGMTDLD